MFLTPAILKSIKFRLFCYYFLLVGLPITIIFLVIHTWQSNVMIENTSEYLINNLSTVSKNVDEILYNIDYSYVQILSDEEFIRIIRELKPLEDRHTLNDFVLQTQINNQLHNFLLTNQYLDSIYLYSQNSQTFFSNQNVLVNHFDLGNSRWGMNYRDRNLPENFWIFNQAYNSNDIIISNYRQISDFKSKKSIGLMSLNVNQQLLKDRLNNSEFKNTGFAFVMNQDGMILSNHQISKKIIELFTNKLKASNQGYEIIDVDEVSLFIAYYTSAYTKWKYIAIAPLNEIVSSSYTIKKAIFIVYLLLIFIFLLLVFITNRYLYKPISQLFYAMRKVETGNLNIKLEDSRSDEFGFINKKFNEMALNLKQLIHDNYVIKLRKKETELKYIQTQINEHFLFNTLDSIHWIARQYQDPQISNMIFSLSKFYRLSLSNGEELLPISTIREMLESYIFIQKIRMQERLTYQFHADEELQQYQVLKYLFQPLVENAITHGIGKKAEGGNISVSFTRHTPDHIRFAVIDTGVGICAEQLQEIIANIDKTNDPLSTTSNFFALKNINLQLKLFYGDSYNLHIESQPNAGTTVWFDFPIAK